MKIFRLRSRIRPKRSGSATLPIIQVRNPDAVAHSYTIEEPDEEGGPVNVPMRIASRQPRSTAGERTKSELNSKSVFVDVPILSFEKLIKNSEKFRVGR